MFKSSIIILLVLLLNACSNSKRIMLPQKGEPITGTAFYQQAMAMNWKQRDSLALQYLLQGNMPSFLQKLTAIKSNIIDSNGQSHQAIFYVTKDYLSIGSQKDWARIPLTPMTAQRLADSLHCTLPTTKMVNLIYEQATVKLAPMPMFAYRDSTATFWQHHLIIEGQRQGRQGLIAGTKKDVVQTSILQQQNKANKVAIYGWHQLNGKPIQPLYTGHVNWYVDYSHGIRLVYEMVKVDGHWMHFKQAIEHPTYQKLFSDEANCTLYKYPY